MASAQGSALPSDLTEQARPAHAPAHASTGCTPPTRGIPVQVAAAIARGITAAVHAGAEDPCGFVALYLNESSLTERYHAPSEPAVSRYTNHRPPLLPCHPTAECAMHMITQLHSHTPSDWRTYWRGGARSLSGHTPCLFTAGP